ncbi:ALP1-like protein [Tanacetum coccineum]
MAYDTVPDALDEYLQMGATTARDNLETLIVRIGRRRIAQLHLELNLKNNDMNVLRQSPIFNDLKFGKALDVPFVANEVTNKRGDYLTDEMYPK